MSRLLIDVDPWMAVALLALAMLAGWAVGWWRGRSIRQEARESPPHKFSDAILALLGLLLGFTASVHGSRVTSVQKHGRPSEVFAAWTGRIPEPISSFGAAKISAKTTVWPARKGGHVLGDNQAPISRVRGAKISARTTVILSWPCHPSTSQANHVRAITLQDVLCAGQRVMCMKQAGDYCLTVKSVCICSMTASMTPQHIMQEGV